MNNAYNIANVKNFYSSFNKENIKEVREKYTILVSAFLLCATENIIVQNEKYFLFVLQRGLETIKHCFKMIYMYTRNLDLTIYHCKKAFCYYVEFIGQIGDDSHSYLQLNSKDATLFIYKKTIFELNNEYRKQFVLKKEETEIYEYIHKFSNVVVEIFEEVANNDNLKSNTKMSYAMYIQKMTNKIINKLIYLKIPIKKKNRYMR